MAQVKIIPTILSGGAGTRLWPLSTPETPKQFHALGSDLTMIQATAERLRTSGAEAAAFLPPVVVCSARHEHLVREQLEACGVRPAVVALEPSPRSTAPAAVVAARLAREIDPEALVLLLPADHLIRDPRAFRTAVATGAAAARDHLVTFGVTPSTPETGYGYIRRGEALGNGAYRVEAFTEKPARELALRYVSEGCYAWNAGIFLFSPAVLLEEMKRLRPDIERGAGAAFDAAVRDGPIVRLDAVRFAACPAESLDYAVMERTDTAAVVPFDAGWADLGAWDEVWRLGHQDEHGNLTHGDAHVAGSAGCLVWSSGRTVAVLGVSDLVVVETSEAVVVLPKARAQELKSLVEQIRPKS